MVIKSKSKENIETIRKAARKNREESPELIEFHTQNSYKQEDIGSIDSLITNYFINLDVLVFWRNKSHEDVDINVAIKTLELKLKRNLVNKFSDLVLFLTMYVKNLTTVDKSLPYPSGLSLIDSNYLERAKSLKELRKEGCKNMKEILEGK